MLATWMNTLYIVNLSDAEYWDFPSEVNCYDVICISWFSYHFFNFLYFKAHSVLLLEASGPL